MTTNEKPTLEVVSDTKPELPDELTKQLSKRYLQGGLTLTKFNTELKLILGDKTMTLDEILVAWYHKSNEVLKRNQLLTRLQRLIKMELIVNAGKGEYRVNVPDAVDSVIEEKEEEKE